MNMTKIILAGLAGLMFLNSCTQYQAQGAGVGKFAVRALAEEARSRGFHRLTVIWEPGEEGPEDFFLRIGFVITGETQYGENIGTLEI